jgi:two-component system sensor histidine kinase CpxA
MTWRAPLFTRILLWFLGLLCFSIVGLLLTAYWAAPRQPDLTPNMLYAELETSVHLLESEGLATMRAFLERRDHWLGGRHEVLDASGRNLVTGADDAAKLKIRRTDGPPPPRPFFPWNRPKGFQPMHVATADGRYHYVITGGSRFAAAPARPHYELYLWVLALVVVLCYLLATTLARPIRELRDAAMAFGRGDLRRRAHVAGGDEIGDLGREFNVMADRIQTLLGAERRLLQDVSHELRSPLARLGFAVELARSSGDPRGAIERIRREAERLTSVVNELIEMTRAEGDPLERKVEAIELDQLVAGLLQDLRVEADAKRVRLNGPAPTGLWVQGDAALLERALGNVVTNAIRYAPEATDVDVTLTVAEGQVAIAVRDRGPGVPEQDLRNIFKPFFRVDESRDRSSGGVGLGLAIAERTALLHHGALRAERAEPGLRVTFSLPVRTGVAETEPVPARPLSA